ncbi:hypothetical protein BCR36DRAFT_332963 [Piromyces finnis]|uniref:Mediator complex subunit 9 n=1 Tax=Piromyces finnis TaxID=1754191 RepID=A0A1Y1V251_9FUNG|nr:hypothetical protein BCR36DRAFT_332963 [Piromyces finnis]|eukprot:ORX45590.1 hypothetical protein BCR36DRAFT_332963 [Piromyces finnis]
MSKQNNNIINKEDFSFLPTILSIFEKINSENMKDTQAIKKISINLLEHIEECKTKVNNLPGIENSNIEQLNKYDEEIKVVNQRRKQFIDYLNMPIFKKFYSEEGIKKQNELISIQKRLEAIDKEKIADIKKRTRDTMEVDTESSTKKTKVESEATETTSSTSETKVEIKQDTSTDIKTEINTNTI